MLVFQWEIFSQISRTAQVASCRPARLDALQDPFVIKTASRPAHEFELFEGAYSAVAQWQSIRLLTEGL